MLCITLAACGSMTTEGQKANGERVGCDTGEGIGHRGSECADWNGASGRGRDYISHEHLGRIEQGMNRLSDPHFRNRASGFADSVAFGAVMVVVMATGHL